VTSGRQLTKKILIVEDEEPVARAPQLKLQRYGIESEIVPDGREALLRLSKEKFDLITLDLILPKMDGFDVLEEIRKKGNPVPVLVVSNLGQEEDIQRAKKLGAIDYFVKSNMQLAQIVERIRGVLKT